jgi:hypothetical protein
MRTWGGATLSREVLLTFRQEDIRVCSVATTVLIDPDWFGPFPPKMLGYLVDIDRRRQLAQETGASRMTMDATGLLWCNCSGSLRVIVSPSFSTGWRVISRDSCKQRYCVVCSDSGATSVARKKVDKVRGLLKEHDASILFITLRGRYCSWDGLREAVSHLHRSVKTFIGGKRFPGLGASRYTEFTRLEEDKLRPHIHMLLVVPKSYSKNPRRYLTKDEWADLWEEISNVSAPGAVKVQTVKYGDVLADVFRFTKYGLTLLDQDWTGEDDKKWSGEEVQRLGLILKGVRLRQDYGAMLFRRKTSMKAGVCGGRRRS